MSKRKEIEVWVDEENIKSNSDEIMIWHKVSKLQAKHLIKARLIFDLPERKATVTESEFETLWKGYCYEEAVKKLFGCNT